MTTTNLIGKRYRSLVPDYEEDEEYGEVMHPIGSEFVVRHANQVDPEVGQMYSVAWQGTARTGQWVGKGSKARFLEDGKSVPAEGMWTIWSEREIATDAEPIATA